MMYRNDTLLILNSTFVTMNYKHIEGVLSMTLYNSHTYMTPDKQGTETSQLTVITWHTLLTISRTDLQTTFNITWCFSDRASWIDCILITNLMHWLLFIHKIPFFSTCFKPQVLIFRRIQLYTCSIWYCHSLWEFLVPCRYTAWVRLETCRGE